jgi:hypothetical protein
MAGGECRGRYARGGRRARAALYPKFVLHNSTHTFQMKILDKYIILIFL